MTQELSQGTLLLLFALSLTCGFALAALYDVFRIRRVAVGANKKRKKLLTRLVSGFIIGVEDIIFFTAAGIATTLISYSVFQGRVRPMSVILEAVGFLLYRLTLGRLVMAVSEAIIALVRRVLSFIYRRLLLPPARVCRRMLAALVGALKRVLSAINMRSDSNRLRKSLLRASKRGFPDK